MNPNRPAGDDVVAGRPSPIAPDKSGPSRALNARRRQQVTLHQQVETFMDGLAELAAELDLGTPRDAVAVPGDGAATESSTAGGVRNRPAEGNGVPRSDGPGHGDDPPHAGARERPLAGVAAETMPAAAQTTAAVTEAAAASATPAPVTQASPEVHPWTPALARAPIPPLAPSPRFTPAPLPADVGPSHRSRARPRRLILVVAGVVLIAVAIIVTVAALHRSGSSRTVRTPAAAMAAATAAPGPSRTGGEPVADTMHLVGAGAGDPFSAPPVSTLSGATASLVLVVHYAPSRIDLSVGIDASRTDGLADVSYSVLNRTFLLTGSGEDSITLTPSGGPFPTGHYVLSVTRAGHPAATLDFDIVPAATPGRSLGQ